MTIKHGKPQKEVESPDGKYPILGTGGEFGRATKFLYDKPSVLIGRKGTIDKPKYMDKPFWTVDTLFYSEIKKNNNPKFLYYIFLTINWKLYNEGSGVPSLSASTISSIKIHVPQEEKEQEAIVNILTTADTEITELEKKLSIIKEQKRYQQTCQRQQTGHSYFLPCREPWHEHVGVERHLLRATCPAASRTNRLPSRPRRVGRFRHR